MAKDFLDEMIQERRRGNPRFGRLVEEATARRELARRLAGRREKAGLSQTHVAAAMGTSQSVVSKLEQGADVRLSTLQRYCAAIGEPFDLAPVLVRRARKPADRKPRAASARSARTASAR